MRKCVGKSKMFKKWNKITLIDCMYVQYGLSSLESLGLLAYQGLELAGFCIRSSAVREINVYENREIWSHSEITF